MNEEQQFQERAKAEYRKKTYRRKVEGRFKIGFDGKQKNIIDFEPTNEEEKDYGKRNVL